MAFQFKSFQNILKDMVAKFLSSTGVSDINPGSVVTTFLEAPSQEDAQQYFQMYQIIRNYNLSTTEGTDLDNRAAEFGLTRLASGKATGIISFLDSSITKVITNVYSGSRGPVSGQNYIDVDDGSSFSASGSIVIGRNTDNTETIAYSSITAFGNFYRLNLTGALTTDHGTDESVILSQGGNRLITSGTVVLVPASDVTDEIQFVTRADATILDGESEALGTPIEAVATGTNSNVAAGTIIQYDTLPFTTATTVNPQAITNGRDRETDDELRDRIRIYIQSLSRGIKAALLSGVLNLQSDIDNKRIASASLIEPVTLNEIVYLYVDDGTGLEPSFSGVGIETVVNSATGGEKFLQLDNFPVIKAQIETLIAQPYIVVAGETLTIAVNDIEETLIFQANDFKIAGSVTAFEVTKAINARSTLVEARTSNNGTKVVLRAIANSNEHINVVGGTANVGLGFPTSKVYTLELYRFDGDTLVKLNKDGNTASIECATTETYNLSGTETLTIVVDGKTANVQTVTFQAGDFAVLGSATAEEVVARINLELAGASASVTSQGQKVTITSNTIDSSISKIKINGGTANAFLNFDTTEVVGANSDYTLNRFNGQIELNTPADSGQQYTVGSDMTRGFLISSNAEPFALTDGDSVVFSIDGGGSKTATFNTTDFINIAQATAQEVASVINANVIGATASVTDDNCVLVRTNTWDESLGSIEITSVTGSAISLGFTISSTRLSLRPHAAYTTSIAGPYSLSEGDNLIVVVDKDADQAVFNIVMDLNGTVTIGDASAPYTTFIGQIDSLSQNFNTKFTSDTDLEDFKIKWLTGANAATVSTVNSYSALTGQFTLTAGLGSAIAALDTFTIIPTTSQNVATYLGNTITSSLANRATVELSEDGTKVELTSLTYGTAGIIQVTGGLANAALSFSTASSSGMDGYEYYTGIIQKVQYTVDGLDSDLLNYPGIKAAGVQVEVLAPVVKTLAIKIDLSFTEEANQGLVKDKAVNIVSSYVNTLGVGKDLILNELVDLLMSIDGVTDVSFIDPTINVTIADNEIARVARDDITIG